MDFTDPQNPQASPGFSEPANIRSLSVSGEFLYVAAGDGGIPVFNLADPEAPVVVDGCQRDSRNPRQRRQLALERRG